MAQTAAVVSNRAPAGKWVSETVRAIETGNGPRTADLEVLAPPTGTSLKGARVSTRAVMMGADASTREI